MDNNQMLSLVLTLDKSTIDHLASIDETLKLIYRFLAAPGSKPTNKDKMIAEEIRGALRKTYRLLEQRLPEVPQKPDEQTESREFIAPRLLRDKERLSLENYMDTDLTDFLISLELNVRTFNAVSRRFGVGAKVEDFYKDYIHYGWPLQKYLTYRFRNMGAASASIMIEALKKRGLFIEYYEDESEEDPTV